MPTKPIDTLKYSQSSDNGRFYFVEWPPNMTDAQHDQFMDGFATAKELSAFAERLGYLAQRRYSDSFEAIPENPEDL